MLNLGILGTARIAREFLHGVRGSAAGTVSGVASRDLARARRFADEHAIRRAYGSYEELLADTGIDAVYVPLPNSLHVDWVIRAAESGKHILCEKPLAIGAPDARRMFAAAHANGVTLREGYPYLAQPQLVRLRQLLADSAIGRIRLIHASFGVPAPAAGDIRYDAALGGGARLDIAAYPVSLVRILVGRVPCRVRAVAQSGPGGVDVVTQATLEYDDGTMAQVSGAFGTMSYRRALIAGDGGTLETNFYNDTTGRQAPDLRLRRTGDADDRGIAIPVAAANGFRAEFEQFAGLTQGDAVVWTGASEIESIDIARMLDAIRESVAEERPIDLR